MRWGFIILMLAISLVSALPKISLQEKNLQPGESLVGNISQIEKPMIKRENFAFYEGRKKVFFDFDFIFRNRTIYFYAYAHRSGRFTLKIENLLFEENGTLKSADFNEEFNVSEKKINESNASVTKILSIRPPFLFAGEKLLLKNLGDADIEVEAFGNKSTLSPGKEISFYPKEKGKDYVEKIKSYKNFDVFVFSKGKIKNETKILPTKFLMPKKKYLSGKIVSGKNQDLFVRLVNLGVLKLEISNVSSRDVGVIGFGNESFGPGEEKNLSVEIFTEKLGSLNGSLEIEYLAEEKKGKVVIPFELFAVEEEITDNSTKIYESKSCDDLGGKFCSKGSLCDGDAPITREGKRCCLNACVKLKDEEDSGSGLLWGLLIMAFLGAIGYFLYRKQKKIKGRPEDRFLKAEAGQKFGLGGKSKK